MPKIALWWNLLKRRLKFMYLGTFTIECVTTELQKNLYPPLWPWPQISCVTFLNKFSLQTTTEGRK